MSAYTRWRQVGLVDAPMVKWETEGQTLEGIFRG